MKFIAAILFCFVSFYGFSQNNYIVKTEDGRRVLLKDNFTWEYIDMPKQQAHNPTPQPVPQKQHLKNTPPSIPNCGLGSDFREPKLNQKIQGQLKRSRSTMKDLKRKVAKDFACTSEEVILISFNEDASKGNYTFCAKGNRITYKRVGNAFFKKGKLF